MTETLPPEFMPFGHVVGRVIRAVGDTAADPDADPEAIPVTGKGLVRFTPLELTRVVADTVPSTWVQQETIAADLDSDGFLSLSGARGLLLWPGAWKVSAGSDSIFSFPAFTIQVTAAHTAASPLDLWTAAPYSPPSGATVTTLVVPTGQQPGQTLGWDGSQLAWVTPKITPSATTLAAGSNATATMSGSWPNLTLGLGIPAGQPSTYQIVGAGRPDIPASMTTAVQAQVAAAPIGATFSSTDGASVGAWTWQKLPSGWQVTFGDTGWRDIRALLGNGWTAQSLAIQRTTRTLTVAVGSLSAALATSATIISGLPTGMVLGTTRGRALLTSTDTPAKIYRLYGSGAGPGQIVISGFSTTLPPLFGTFQVSCAGDAWPLTVPGTAIADPVGF